MTSVVLTLAAITISLQLPPGLLSAVCYVESHHNPEALHLDDGTEPSVGLCQLHPSTAKLMGFKGTNKELMNPNVNAFYAGKYLKRQLIRYHGDTNAAVAAYNAGRHNIDKKGRTRNSRYVRKVYAAWEVGR